MCDHLGVNYLDIPLSDSRVFSLFSTHDELNLKHNYLKLKNGGNIEAAKMGVPVFLFGYPYIRQL